jgi:hypothetical protein
MPIAVQYFQSFLHGLPSRSLFRRGLPVGTLPKGYVRNVPLPRVPLRQSATAHQLHGVPDYYYDPYGVPTYGIPRSIVEKAAYAFSPVWHAIAINT